MNTFKTPFQAFVYARTYSRWEELKNRRENWEETVKRYIDYMRDRLEDKVTPKELKDAYNAIYNLQVMPSMRGLWAAGPAIDADNLALFNCSFVAITSLKKLAELLYILMNGTGAGFSVERNYTNQLPSIAEIVNNEQHKEIIFQDSKIGWAEGYLDVLDCLWKGIPFTCDYSLIRPKGARLKTFGGRASGPDPLKDLVLFTTNIIEKNRGTQLQPIDVHDICCKIAEVVVVGGVRRSALLSLSDLTDNQIANAKVGEFWNEHPQRVLANNSVAYTRKPDIISFLDEWKHLYKSKAGERGIFSRTAAIKKANENSRRDGSQVAGINPCGEVLLRDQQLCNLTEVIVRPEDTFETLKTKIKIATMLGTWQSFFTNFNFVDEQWKKNCDEERLLGVSMSGLRDHPILGTVNDTAKKWLSDLKHIAIQTNKKTAQKLNINRATAITTIKPSGTVSSLVDCSPGAHVRQTKTGYYIRRIRISATDPLFKMMKDQGIKYSCEVGQTPDTCNTYVLEFITKAPETAKNRKDETAEEQLEYWKMLRNFYCEHNPSITISVKEDEWLETASWVYKNFDDVCGLSFLPSSDHIYQLAPYEDITKEQYDELIKNQPVIDFSKLSEYEAEDNTEGAKEYACTAGSCELK